MRQAGITKIDSPLFNAAIRKGRDVFDSDAIPTDYLNINTTMVPMKRELLADLKTGKDIDGARLVKSNDSLVI